MPTQHSLLMLFTRWSLLSAAAIALLSVDESKAQEVVVPAPPVLTFMLDGKPISNLTTDARNRIIQEMESAVTSASMTSHHDGAQNGSNEADPPKLIESSGTFLHVTYSGGKSLVTPSGALRMQDLYLELSPDKSGRLPMKRMGWFCLATTDHHYYFFAHLRASDLTSAGALLANPDLTEPLLRSGASIPLVGWPEMNLTIDATLNGVQRDPYLTSAYTIPFSKPPPPAAPTPLADAIANDDYAAAQKLIATGAEIDDWNISDAMANQQPRIVKLLWDHAKNRGSELRYEISQRATVAQVAAMLQNGSTVEPDGDDFIDPLGVAAANGDLPMIQLLLAHGADPNWRGRRLTRYSALSLAVEKRRLDMVTYILDHGGQTSDFSAMISALMDCMKVYPADQRQISLQIARLLVERGALDHLPQNRGIYLYIACADVADPVLVKLLLDHGSNPEEVAIDGQGTAPVIQQVREAAAGKNKKPARPELQPILALLEAVDKPEPIAPAH
jgi:hypothetical protein